MAIPYTCRACFLFLRRVQPGAGVVVAGDGRCVEPAEAGVGDHVPPYLASGHGADQADNRRDTLEDELQDVVATSTVRHSRND